MSEKVAILLFISLYLVLASPCMSGDLRNSPHDLSAGGYTSGNPCRYCHTPHGALAGIPFWNHKLSSAVYKIYRSTSLDADVGQPTGASKLCLSCHDGTVALGEVMVGPNTLKTLIAPGHANLGTDLSDDHPISFVYSSALISQDPQLRSPLSLPSALQLDSSSELQCTTCHDPHDNTYGKFLVMSNARSQMCISCHDLKGWAGSIHARSNALSLSADDTYLQNSKYVTVAANGCNSCHRPHSAGGHERLLHFARSEDNCLNCHNGSVAKKDIAAELNKFSRHDVRRYDGIHDINESFGNMSRHVECVDCHNPHAVVKGNISGVNNIGALQGVSGVTIAGNYTPQAQYEYEVCFKCHGDNPDRIQSAITRQFTQSNTRLEFDTGNNSFHPVAGPGVNPHVPSLVAMMNVTSVIKCTDCHNSDNPRAVNGPHGSRYPYLLTLNYETRDETQESAFAYALCYKCHSRNSILNDESFPKHREHLEKKISCSACHDPHGIDRSQGGTRNTHLINFDLAVVSAESSSGRLEYEDLGTFHGRCYLNCHGVNHSPETY